MVGFTGLGSLPGTDFAAALRLTFDKVAGLPYLPELPARGPWAGLVGRGFGLPTMLPAELAAGEWRLAGAPGIDQRRARATWRDDLDRLEEEAQGYVGRFKVAVPGPWTLAAATGVAHTGRVLADRGARSDLAGALAEATGELLSDLARRLPGCDLVLQVDEPGLPAVAAGAVPTPGGYFRHRAVDLPELCLALESLAREPERRGLAAAAVLHSCAPWPLPGGWPLGSLLAGFAGFSFDLDQLGSADWDALAASVDAGKAVYLGCLPTTGAERPIGIDALRRRALVALERIQPGAAEVVLSPACGLAGWQPGEVSRGFSVLAAAAAQVSAELGRG